MKNIKNMLYKTLDTITFNSGIPRTVNGFRVFFPARWSRYFEHDYESENVAFMVKICKPGMTVIDIGAHLGLMSVTFTKLVGASGKVISFEPTPKTFKVLQQVIKLNRATHIVEAVNAAVAREAGEIDFFIAADDGSNSNSLVSKNHRKRTPIRIKVTSLDAFIEKRGLHTVDFIKIDAEGSEYDVLLGARQTLSRFNPKIILAMHPPLIENNKQKVEDIYHLIRELKYEITYGNKVITKEEFCRIRDFFDVHLVKEIT